MVWDGLGFRKWKNCKIKQEVCSQGILWEFCHKAISIY